LFLFFSIHRIFEISIFETFFADIIDKQKKICIFATKKLFYYIYL